MFSQSLHLPNSQSLNIAGFSRLFADTTTSYKYLLFIALLDILQRRKFDQNTSISFREILIEMLANAWYPHTYFKLSFGTQDKITDKLDSLNLVITEPILKFQDKDKKDLRETINTQELKELVSYFKKNVFSRLIRPFLLDQLKIFNVDYEVVIKTPEIAHKCWESHKPLYCFNSHAWQECDAIIWHPEWVSYIENNYVIVRGWVCWEWLQYMQKCNPNVPAIANKLFAPQQRSSLKLQTDYWKIVLKNIEIKCIYSDLIITEKNMALDHYLPWSFVAHDRLWNLIPTIPTVNSAKSNKIPSDQYFQKFVHCQHLGLITSQKYLKSSKWRKEIEPFLADLKVTENDLLNLDRLTFAYQSTINPLISLAKNQGFIVEWYYQK